MVRATRSEDRHDVLRSSSSGKVERKVGEAWASFSPDNR
jgi:hypothetical protein